MTNLFFYSFIFWIAGVALLFVTYFRYRRYGDPILLCIFYYLLAFDTTAFVSIIGGTFNFLTLRRHLISPDALATSSMTLAVLSVPMSFICWFFFMRMMAGLMGRKIGGAIGIIYLAAQIFAFVAFGAMIISVTAVPPFASPGAFKAPRIALQWLGCAIHFLALAQIALFSGNLGDIKRRKLVRKFGGMYAVLLAVLYGLMLLPPPPAIFYFVFTALYFASNYIPLLYMLTVLRRESLEIPASVPGPNALSRLTESHGLTKREQEIVGLILTGKDNVDIHKALFISPGTVRNHVSSIYRKLGLKNRYQLLVLARTNGAGESAFDSSLRRSEKRT